jgi:hypothetical protein
LSPDEEAKPKEDQEDYNSETSQDNSKAEQTSDNAEPSIEVN